MFAARFSKSKHLLVHLIMFSDRFSVESETFKMFFSFNLVQRGPRDVCFLHIFIFHWTLTGRTVSWTYSMFVSFVHRLMNRKNQSPRRSRRLNLVTTCGRASSWLINAYWGGGGWLRCTTCSIYSAGSMCSVRQLVWGGGGGKYRLEMKRRRLAGSSSCRSQLREEFNPWEEPEGQNQTF